MTYTGITEMISSIGLPWAYDHFAEGESPGLPFIVFMLTGSDNFDADDTVYAQFVEIAIELYTDRKYPPYEKQVEDVLDANEIPWDKTETEISTPWEQRERHAMVSGTKMYEVRYAFDVLFEHEEVDENDSKETND